MPNKPTKVFVDADVILFQAASAGEQIIYTYHDKSGKEVARFNSAREGANWLEEVEMMGMDIQFGYEGDLSELERKTSYEDKGLDKCKEAWNTAIEYMKKDIGEDLKYTILVSPATGLRNFRYDVATIKPYKGNRKDVRTPMYLEQTRKWVQSLPEVKSPKVRYEIDDVCLAYAQLNGEKGMAVAVDKDVRTAVGCWVYNYGDMDEPEWSDPNTVGYLDWDGKKMRGLGYLFLLYQSLSGDKADNYEGIKRFGPAKAFELLSPYNHKSVSYMKELLELCIEEYRKVYGDEYIYKSCQDGSEMKASPFNLFKENLTLAYMVKGDKDNVEKSILKHLNKENV